jgi:hypothetical protein
LTVGKIPKNAKKPTDHKPKQSAKDEAKGKDIVFEHDGITYTIAAEAVDDAELTEQIADMQAGESQLLPLIVRRLLGVEQWKAFKDAARDKAGRIPHARLSDLFEAMDDAVGNSSGSQ